MFELMIGVAAAVAFPVAAIMVQQGRERRRNRKAGRRRNDKIRL
jgi:type II secretory pathway pseudopilin PulG